MPNRKRKKPKKTVHVLSITSHNNNSHVFKVYSQKPSVEKVIEDLSEEFEWQEGTLFPGVQTFFNTAPYGQSSDHHAQINEYDLE